MVLLALPPPIDSPPEFCFCGRKTVQSHEFWFCSSECARKDSLRSLAGNSNCHYRNIVRDAYIRAGTPELQPRRMMSAVHLRTGPSEQRGFANAPARFLPPTSPPHQNNPVLALAAEWDRCWEELHAPSGEPRVTGRQDRSRRQGFQGPPPRASPVPGPGDHTFEQISLDAIPLPEHVPLRPLRHIPSLIDVAKNNTKKSPVAALLNFGRSRKVNEVEDPERVFGHPVDTVVRPLALVRKDPRRMGRAF